MIKKLFLILAILVAKSAGILYYDQIKLILAWPATYCKSNYDCRRDWLSTWNKYLLRNSETHSW